MTIEENRPASARQTVIPAVIFVVVVMAVMGGLIFAQQATGGSLLVLPDPQIAANPKIAFMSDREGNWEIYLMDSDGSNLNNLTNNPTNEVFPVAASSQNQLAYATQKVGVGLEITLIDLEGLNQISLDQLPAGSNFPLAWSYDGQYLVLIHDEGRGQELVLIEPATQQTLNLTRQLGATIFGSWSPADYRFIVGIAEEEGVTTFVSSVEGTIEQFLTDGSYPAAQAQWSPNGQYVAFTAIRNNDVIDIFVVDAAGGEPVNLTQSLSIDIFPQWSPDSSRIAFLSDRDGNPEIYVMDMDGGNSANLTNHPANDAAEGNFSWSPLGDQILFHSDRDNNIEVYVMNADGTSQVNLSNNQGGDFAAVWVLP